MKVESKEKSKWRPLPMSTIEFNKMSTKKLHITSAQSMEIAEKLYNKGYISYPRTETEIFPDAMNLKELVEIQK